MTVSLPSLAGTPTRSGLVDTVAPPHEARAHRSRVKDDDRSSSEDSQPTGGDGPSRRDAPHARVALGRCARGIRSTSAALLNAPQTRVNQRREAAGQRAWSRKGTRTLDLLITSNPTPSAVLTSATVHGTRITRERKRQSYQLSRRAARVDVVHSRQLTRGGSHQQALEPPYRALSFRSVPGSVVAQQHARAIVKPRHPRVLKSMRSP